MTPKSYYTADASGRILTTYLLDAAAFRVLRAGGAEMTEGVARLGLDYIKDGVVTPRPENPAVLTGTTLSSLPHPCVVIVNGESDDCESDTFEVPLIGPGTHYVRIQAWPYLDAELVVHN